MSGLTKTRRMRFTVVGTDGDRAGSVSVRDDSYGQDVEGIWFQCSSLYE